MGAIATLTAAAIRRRRLQGAIIGAVLFFATASCTLALDVLVGTHDPFTHAFTSANGAHLVLTYDAGIASPDSVAATATAPRVTLASGPWATGLTGLLVSGPDAPKGGLRAFAPIAISARPSPDTAVDHMTVTDGRWWQSPGEIVLSANQARVSGAAVGSSVTLQSIQGVVGTAVRSGSSAAGQPPASRTLTVVGIAASISTGSVRAWLSPTDLAALVNPDAPQQLEMLYRVDPSATPADLAAAAASITQGLPDRSVLKTSTWLSTQTGVNSTADLMVPILLAFGAFAFLAGAFIVVNVVSGVVIGSTRQIGLLKAVGTTPRQVSAVLVGQVLVPSTIGALLGVVVGVIASGPVLAQTAAALGVPGVEAIPFQVLVAVPVAALLVTTLAALLPAWRAGRMHATEAIATGATPSRGRAARLTRALLARPALPESVALGVGRMASHPLRTLMTLGALGVAVAALTFTVGMEASLRQVSVVLFRDHASPVRAEYIQGPGARPGATAPISAAEADRAIAATPGVSRVVTIGEADLSVPGLATAVPYFAYRGDSSWLGYGLISGRWFAAPGEVVVPTNFLTQTGLHVGDTVHASLAGTAVDLRIVGEIFDDAQCRCDGPRNVVMRGSWDTLAAVDPALQPSSWEIANDDALISPAALAHQIREATGGIVDAYTPSSGDSDVGFLFFVGLVATLGIVLIVVSLAGVVNTVLLEARERARQTAILRAVGMTPRQVIAMVIASVVPLGLVAALIGIPVGLALQRATVSDMGEVSLQTGLTPAILDPLTLGDLGVVVLAALALAALGAWLPARRTSASPIAPVLQAE